MISKFRENGCRSEFVTADVTKDNPSGHVDALLSGTLPGDGRLTGSSDVM